MEGVDGRVDVELRRKLEQWPALCRALHRSHDAPQHPVDVALLLLKTANRFEQPTTKRLRENTWKYLLKILGNGNTCWEYLKYLEMEILGNTCSTSAAFAAIATRLLLFLSGWEYSCHRGLFLASNILLTRIAGILKRPIAQHVFTLNQRALVLGLEAFRPLAFSTYILSRLDIYSLCQGKFGLSFGAVFVQT